MAKATRSPVLGYNHNVRYHGRVYHVQTEDSGPGHTRIFTHLFFEGSIIASKRHEYGVETQEDQVKVLMQSLHKAILRELKQGLYDDKIVSFFASRGQDGFLDYVDGDAPHAGFAAPPAPASEPPPATWAAPPQEALLPDLIEEAAPLYAAPSTPPPVAAPMVAVTSGTAVVQALDLDALPPIEEEPPLPPVIVDPPSAPHQGLGVYSMRGATAKERPFETPAEGVMPPRPPSPSPPAGRPPVVVIRPPVRRPVPRPTPTSSPPPGGVVVQRTVVVGVGGVGPNGQRPRRPRPAVPYVVKEGSHPIVQNPRAAQVAPPIPAATTPPAPSTITDKSLDEVILAYLSQDNEPKR